MFLLAGSLFSIAWDARTRAVKATDADANRMPADATVALILAAAATEGFINEFGELGWTVRDGPHAGDIYPPFMEYGSVWREIEKSNGSTKLKYLMASLVLTGRAFDKGADPYQDWSTLMKLRDSHMHLKAQNFTTDGTLSDLGILKQPEPVAELQQKGIARTLPPRTLLSWLEVLQTGGVADWACRASLGIISAVLDMAPLDEAVFDPLIGLRFQFQSNECPWRGGQQGSR